MTSGTATSRPDRPLPPGSRSPAAVLIGIGNPYRRDDGVGPALAAAVGELALPGLAVLSGDAEPSRLLDAWSGVRLAVLVDAARSAEPVPGLIRRSVLAPGAAIAPTGSASTHGLGIADAIQLAQAVDQLPGRLVLFTVEAADIGFGLGLSPAVAASLPELIRQVRTDLTAG